MAGAFAVSIPDSMNAIGSRNGVRGAVVYANNSADAIDFLQSLYGGDLDALWEGATVTAVAAAADMVGWTLRVVVQTPDNDNLYDVEVIGAGADDTIDEIAALMVTALEAAGGADLTPSYASNVLTIAAIADDIGDHHITVEWYAPNSRVAIPGFVLSTVDEGIAGAVLTATFAADAYTVPAVTKKFLEAVS